MFWPVFLGVLAAGVVLLALAPTLYIMGCSLALKYGGFPRKRNPYFGQGEVFPKATPVSVGEREFLPHSEARPCQM